MWREVVQLVMALGVHQSGLSVPDRQSRWLSGPGWSIAEGGAGVCHGSSEIPDSAGSSFSPCRQVQRDHKYSLIDGGIIFGSHSEWNNPPALNCLKEVRGHLGEKHDWDGCLSLQKLRLELIICCSWLSGSVHSLLCEITHEALF